MDKDEIIKALEEELQTTKQELQATKEHLKNTQHLQVERCIMKIIKKQ